MAGLLSHFLPDVASKGKEKLYEKLFDAVGREMAYVLWYVDDNEAVSEKLRNTRQRVEVAIRLAETQGENIELYDDVKRWLSNEQKFTEEDVKSINTETDKAGKSLVKWIKRRYKHNKNKDKLAKAGARLVKEGEFNGYGFSFPREVKNSMHVRGYESFDSRESNFQEIIKALKDAQSYVIAVYGMGGVGKTTLVKKVAEQVVQDKLFDTVVMAEVTEKVDYKNILEQIAWDLGLEFREESVFQLKGRICNRLKTENRVLIILDNIWKELDLEAIGIPLTNVEKSSSYQKEEQEGIDDKKRRCKILLTSRNKNVGCKDMETHDIFVSPLPDKEAINWFQKIVGDSAEKSDFSSVAVEIVRKCGGLPIAIKTIGNGLKNKSVYAWNDALSQLRMGKLEDISGVIKLSYDMLKENEAKSVFLLCSLFNAGYNIHIDELLSYGIGLKLFGSSKLENARDRVHKLIDDLKASCLLLEGETCTTFKMHDIVHSVAVSIASNEHQFNNIRNDDDSKEMLEEKILVDSIAISMPSKDIYELPERLNCPKLELFLLLAKDVSLQIPDSFFEGTKELKVLDLKCVQFPSLSSSLCYLTSLRTLRLDSCTLGDVAAIAQLRKLEILSFSKSNIQLLPGEIGQLTRLILLDLSNCSRLKVIVPNVISSLSRLEQLYMGNSFIDWDDERLKDEERRNASLAELRQLHRMIALDIHIRDSKMIPQDLFYQQCDLKRYRILIGDVKNWSGGRSSRMLKLKLNMDIYLGYGILKLLEETEDLYLEGQLNGVRNILYELDGDGFPNLKYLDVKNVPDLLYIVNMMGHIPFKAFPKLESLILCDLIRLEKICNGQLIKESFSKLRIVKVRKCDRLNYLFSLSILKSLSKQVEEIEVSDCKKLKGIVGKEQEDLVHTNETIELIQLHSLSLHRLPQFADCSFNAVKPLISKAPFATKTGEIVLEESPKDAMSLFRGKVIFPCLTNLKLSSVNIKDMLDQLPAMSFCCQNLTELMIEGCNGLKIMFSSSVVNSLGQLQILEICDCKSLEGLTETGLGEDDTIKMNFPKMAFLKLKGLPKLIGFGTVELPSLVGLWIESCPNLKTFSPSSTGSDITVTGDLWNWSGCQSSRMLKLKLNKNIYLGHGIGKFLEKTEDLYLDELSGFRNILYELGGCGFPNLKYLHVQNALELLYIVNSREVHTYNRAFPMLKSLILYGLINLEKICNGQLVKRSFSKLRSIKVKKCDRLNYLLSLCMAKSVSKQLEEIEVAESKKLKEIVGKENEDYDCKHETIEFIQLHSLTLQCLPHFTDFSFNVKKSLISKTLSATKIEEIVAEESLEDVMPLSSEKVIFPNLRNLKLSSINIEHVLDQLPAMSFCCQNLTKLMIEGCDGLKILFSSSVINSLAQLQILEICDCKSLERITEKGLGEECMIEMRNLVSLKLKGLPKFTGFGTAELRSLLELWIEGCPNLKTFCSSSSCLDMIVIEEPEQMSLARNLHAYLQPLFDEYVRFPKLKKLKILRMDNLGQIWHSQVPPDSFNKLKELDIGYCNKLVNIFPLNMLEMLPRLKELEVHNCDSVEEIFSSDGGMPVVKATQFRAQLKILHLCHLPNLKHLWKFDAQGIRVFKNLSSIFVQKCKSLKSFFPASVARSLEQLKVLHISDCMVEEVVAKEDLPDESHTVFLFSKLTSLTMTNLSRLQCFYPGLHITRWPKLKKLTMRGCQQIQVFASAFSEIQQNFDQVSIQRPVFLVDKDSFPSLEELTVKANYGIKEMWHGKDSIHLDKLKVLKLKHLCSVVPCFAKFQNLMILEVSKCDGLKNLMTHSTVETLVKLTRLKITECKMLEQIVMPRGDDKKEKIVFKQLKYLGLHCLPSLIGFFLGNYTLEFPGLEQVIVCQCPNMMCFSQGTIITPKLHIVQTTKGEDKGCWNGDLNATILQLFEEMVGFNGLEYLELSKYPRLKKIWHGELPLNFFSNLKLLVVDEYEFVPSAIPASRLHDLKNLEVVCVRNCDSIKEVFDLQERSDLPKLSYIWKQNNLEILSFKNLKSLEVNNCNNLRYIFTLSLVLGLVHLRNMTIRNCNMLEGIVREEGDVDASTNKVIFHHLDSIILESLPNLKSFCVGSKQSKDATLFCDKVGLPSLKRLEILHMDMLRKIWHDVLYDDSFYMLRELRIGFCKNLLNIFPCNMPGIIQRLETLVIWYCDLVEEIFEFKAISREETPFITASQLRELWVINLPNLKHVWNMDSQRILAFRNLLLIKVHCCNSLKTLFPAYVARGLINLVILEILSCNVEEMVAKEKVEEVLTPRFVFHQLTSLVLASLPSLKNFYPGKNISEWPKLKKLILSKCDKVEIFASEFPSLEDSLGKDQDKLFSVQMDAFPCLEELSLVQLPMLLHLWKQNYQRGKVFQNLKTLEVSHCFRLTHLITFSAAKNLMQLERLDIIRCFLMQQIIADKGYEEDEGEHEIIFGQLKYLRLCCLPNLSSVCLGNRVLEFPSLEGIAGRCVRMSWAQRDLSTKRLHRRLELRGRDDAFCVQGILSCLSALVVDWTVSLGIPLRSRKLLLIPATLLSVLVLLFPLLFLFFSFGCMCIYARFKMK